MIRFIEDLGIIPNKGKPFENDPNLKQGQKMMEYGRIYNFFNMNKIREIESDTYPSKKDNVKTIVETMETIESTSQGKSKIVLENAISTHEAEFYRLLGEYSNTNKLLEKEMLENDEADHKVLITKVTKLYDSLISISSVIENEFTLLQTISDKKLADDFVKKKDELAEQLKKLKKDREEKKANFEIHEEEEKINKFKTFGLGFGFIILILMIIHQILYEVNIFSLYIIFLAIVSIVAIDNNYIYFIDI